MLYCDSACVAWVTYGSGMSRHYLHYSRVLIDTGVPKTRSGKIMRRILRKIASKQEKEIGDTSTLADPSVVDQLLETRGK